MSISFDTGHDISRSIAVPTFPSRLSGVVLRRCMLQAEVVPVLYVTCHVARLVASTMSRGKHVSSILVGTSFFSPDSASYDCVFASLALATCGRISIHHPSLADSVNSSSPYQVLIFAYPKLMVYMWIGQEYCFVYAQRSWSPGSPAFLRT